MPVKITVTHGRTTRASGLPLRGSWVHRRLHLKRRPQHAVAIKGSNKWDCILNAANRALSGGRAPLAGTLRAISIQSPFRARRTRRPGSGCISYVRVLAPRV